MQYWHRTCAVGSTRRSETFGPSVRLRSGGSFWTEDRTEAKFFSVRNPSIDTIFFFASRHQLRRGWGKMMKAPYCIIFAFCFTKYLLLCWHHWLWCCQILSQERIEEDENKKKRRLLPADGRGMKCSLDVASAARWRQFARDCNSVLYRNRQIPEFFKNSI